MKINYFKLKMQKLMNLAWSLVSNSSNMTMSSAMKLAWKDYYIRKQLSTGKVEFSYKKKDGSIRKALGTTMLEIIPKEAANFSDKQFSQCLSQVRYFDIESNGWRSFQIANLI